MENILKDVIVYLLLCGVFGDPDKVTSVYEGDYVTLPTNTTIQRDDKIMWRFEEAGSPNLLVQMLGNRISYNDFVDGRFKDRLQILDSKSGDLTIKNMRTKHTGLYEAEINTGTGTSYKRFRVVVKGAGLSSGAVAGICVFFLLVILAGTAVGVFLYRRKKETVIMPVFEGDPVILHGADSELQPGAQIEWKFKDQVIMTGEMKKGKGIHVTHLDDQQFNVRLELNPYFGSLIIKNISKENMGLYEGNITYNKETSRTKFQVNVIDKIVSVSEGDPVILHAAKSEVQPGAQIEWKFDGRVIITGVMNKDKGINVINRNDQQFKDRLNLNNAVGYLTINKVSKKDTGLYEVNITKDEQTSRFKLHVKVTGIDPLNRLQGDMTVTEGDPVTIPGDESEVQPGVQIVWTFNNRVIITGRKTNDEGICITYNDDQQFKDRLELNPNVGSLIINNVSMKDSGYYEIMIANDEETSRTRIRFRVIVSARTNRNEPTAVVPLLNKAEV
ncbi:uncharacterized protein [Paramisgurnus dabryanus]|uniref:uncharacterized protein isoform X2 n=1 Tax=Paramisgurnus dabryanus TaxID=90735 RepID=UPI0031F3865B